MKSKILIVAFLFLGMALFIHQKGFSYPPAVGIVGKAKNCLVCHVNNGPWQNEDNTIIDILDKETKESFRQNDGSFLIQAQRGKIVSVLTVIGRKEGDQSEPPYRNAWVYVDPQRIKSDSLSKFAPGWNVNLPMACRIIGDKLEGFEGSSITVLPMSIRAGDDAQNAELQLQVMLTKGESVKGNAKQGMIGSYYEKIVRLKILE